ncbi:Cell division coordinator CpoB [Candidatus Entotheonellaceae bacterium PAL068K]
MRHRSSQRRVYDWWLVGFLALSLFVWGQVPVRIRAQPVVSPTSSEPPTGFSAHDLLAFAEQLMREGEYYRAVTEFRRLLFSYPHDPRRAMIHFRIGVALYRGQQYKEALRTFLDVTQHYPDTPYAHQARLWQGESLMRQAQYGTAADVYRDIIIEQSPQGQSDEYAHYQRGWAFLYQRQWHKASAQFQHVPPESSLYRAAQHLTEEVLDGGRLARKSPLLAGLLSVFIPGSGQLYNGRWGDSLLAVVLNGLFIGGITQAIVNDELAIAGVLSFFEAGWYTGNVYGAVNGAHKHNRHVVETFIRNLENRFRVEPPQAHHTIGIRVSFGF